MAYKWQGNFVFNAIQNISATIVAGRAKLFGDAVMSAFYLFSQLYGYRNWKNNSSEGKLSIEKRSNWFLIAFSIVVGFVFLGGISYALGGAFIILDSLNNSTAIVAQIMQMRRNRNSWILWIITNLIGIYIWAGVGVPQMAVMYTVFTLNSVRGYINWSE